MLDKNQGNKKVTVYIDGIFEYHLKQEDGDDKEQNIIHVMPARSSGGDDATRIAQGGNSILHIFDEFSALPINVNNDLPIRDFDRTTTPYYLNRFNFVGLLKKNPLPTGSIANNFFAVSDFGYSPSVALTSFDDDLHKMQERIFDSSPSGPVIRESIIAWFSPFHKENTAGEIIEDSNFSLDQIVDTFSINSLGLTPYERFRWVAKLQVLQTKDGSMPQYLLYDIETGGNALSNDTSLTVEANNGKISTLNDVFPTINESEINRFKRLANSGNLGINGLRILLSSLHQIAFENNPGVRSYIGNLWELVPASGLDSTLFDLNQIDEFSEFGFGNKTSINSKPTGIDIWKVNYNNDNKFNPNLPSDNDLDSDVNAWSWDKTTIPAYNWVNIKKNRYRMFLNEQNQNSNSNKQLYFSLFINRPWIIRLLRDSIFDTENNNCQS